MIYTLPPIKGIPKVRTIEVPFEKKKNASKNSYNFYKVEANIFIWGEMDSIISPKKIWTGSNIQFPLARKVQLQGHVNQINNCLTSCLMINARFSNTMSSSSPAKMLKLIPLSRAKIFPQTFL